MCGLKHGKLSAADASLKSHPSWVCGLKLIERLKLGAEGLVTPFVGVWIETSKYQSRQQEGKSHTLRGCVD